MIATRSSGVNGGFFSGFTSTATRMRSNRCALRRTMSTCPFVSGSKDPGKIASLPFGGVGISQFVICDSVIGDLRAGGQSPCPNRNITSRTSQMLHKRQCTVARLHVANTGEHRGNVGLAPRRALQHEQATGGKARRGGLERWTDRMEVVRGIQQDQIERADRLP